MMNIKSRNQLIFEENKQLLQFTSQIEKETKKKLVNQIKNDWNQRPYIAIQYLTKSNFND